jgi:hypothetical protein
MNIPKYWSKATADNVDQRGKRLEISCWRSSNESSDDAQASALVAAKQALASILGGRRAEHYWYARGPIREEVIERFIDSRGALIAAITRNRYGSLVLNTAHTMFVDWDTPRAKPASLIQLIKRLCGGRPAAPDNSHEASLRERIDRYRENQSGWSARLYRTAGGYRGLVTHAVFDPTNESTLAALRDLGSDSLFIRLCQSQASFRARLTPKPWRCRAGRQSFAWPREGGAIGRFEKWLARYDERSKHYSTCQFVDTIGASAMHPDAAPIVELHDKLTRANEALPLA